MTSMTRNDGSYWYHNPYRLAARRNWRDRKDWHKHVFGDRCWKNCGRKPHFRVGLPKPEKHEWIDMQGNYHSEWRKVWDEEPGWWKKGGRVYRYSERFSWTIVQGFAEYNHASRFPKCGWRDNE